MKNQANTQRLRFRETRSRYAEKVTIAGTTLLVEREIRHVLIFKLAKNLLVALFTTGDLSGDV